MPETRVECKNSIIFCPEEATLIRQIGDDTVANQRNKFVWSGNQHLYDGVKTFWEVSDMQGRTNADRKLAADWHNHWSPNETPVPRDLAELGWKTPPMANAKALRERTSEDYALREDSPAVGKAAGGRDIGARLGDLPRVPPRDRRPTPETPTPETPTPEASTPDLSTPESPEPRPASAKESSSREPRADPR